MAAALGGRRLILMDENPDAIRIMADRLAYARPLIVGMNCDNGLQWKGLSPSASTTKAEMRTCNGN